MGGDEKSFGQKLITFAALVLFPLFLIFALFFPSCVGYIDCLNCGGRVAMGPAKLVGLLGGTEVTFDLKGRCFSANYDSTYSGRRFTTSWDEEKLLARAEKSVDGIAEMTMLGDTLEDGALFKADTGDGTYDCWVLYKDGEEYVLSALWAKLMEPTHASSIKYASVGRVLYPQHLTELVFYFDSAPELLLDTLYKTDSGYSEFLEFYESCGWYTLKTTDGAIILTGYTKNPPPDRYQQVSLPFPVVIEFSEENGEHYFQFSVSTKASG